MAGRAYLYGLGAAGERGVDRVLDWFRADLVRTMSLVGAGTIADLDRSLIDLPNKSHNIDAFIHEWHATLLGMVELPPIDRAAVPAFWARGQAAGAIPSDREAEVPVERFGDSAELADELLDLVLHGPKRATAGSVAAFEQSGSRSRRSVTCGSQPTGPADPEQCSAPRR